MTFCLISQAFILTRFTVAQGAKVLSPVVAILLCGAGVVSSPGAAPSLPTVEAAVTRYSKVAEGFYVRPVSAAAMPGGRYRLLVWAAVAGPARRTRPIAFPGGAALIVQSGEGEAVIGDRHTRLRLGESISLDAGNSVAFVNRQTRPIKLRVVIVEAL